MVEAPYSTKAAKSEYGRFFAAFHVGSDGDGDGDVDNNEAFAKAVFLGVIDPTGQWAERSQSEYDGSWGN
jgi:hypothetical protein